MTSATTPPAPADAPPADRIGRIETHGIDVIPDAERHGRARELFTVWAAPNTSFLALVVGTAVVLMGLNLWQALAVIVIGNLFSIVMGIVAVTGPASGTPSEVTMRAMFGIRGNRVSIAVTGWFVCVVYLALNWAAASLTAFSLAERAGIPVNTGVKILIILVIAAATLAISVYGHATIVKLYVPLTIGLAVVFAVFAVFVLGQAHWDYQPAEPLHGVELWATASAGVALIASGPLSYSNSADFARYLPRTTSPFAVAGWTALGSAAPSVLLSTLGALAATAVDMTDPEAGFESMLPQWFVPIFLLAVIAATIANNATTAYSSGLALQSMGVKLRRSRSVMLDGTLGVALTLYALLVSNFLDSVSNMMQLIVALTGPVMAIYATDIVTRRNRYDGTELSDETGRSPFWYHGGVNMAGVIALVTGVVLAVLSINAPVYTGPIAAAVGGIDLSLPAGMLSAAIIYVALTRRLYPIAVPA